MVEVAVIGAGPYGLSTAAHLRGRQIPFRIFGKPMGLWRDHMPAGMLLKSDGFATNLAAPGNAFPLSQFYRETGRSDYSDIGLRVPLKTLVQYGLEFQRRHVGGVEETQVARLTRVGNGFNVVLESGEHFFASKVIVATGPLAYRSMPRELEGLPADLVSHSAMTADLTSLRGRRVVIIGGGQSALETAALLREQGTDVTVVVRRPLFWFDPAKEDAANVTRSRIDRIRRPNFGLGPGWRTWFLSECPAAYHYLPATTRHAHCYSAFGPAGSGWLKDRVDGQIPVLVGGITAARERAGRIKLSIAGPNGATTLTADHVLAATGYKTDLTRVNFLADVVQQIRRVNGAPELNRRFESSVAGLHFIGYPSAPSFGPSVRFIYGARFAANRVTEHLIEQGPGRERVAAGAQLQGV